MSFTLTKATITLVIISLMSISLITFMMGYDDFYGVDVPVEYQDSFNNYDALQEEYSEVQQTVEQGEVEESSSDFGVFKSAITAVRQLGNIGVFANNILNDLARFLRIPDYWIQGLFLVLAILIVSGILAFFTRGASP